MSRGRLEQVYLPNYKVSTAIITLTQSLLPSLFKDNTKSASHGRLSCHNGHIIYIFQHFDDRRRRHDDRLYDHKQGTPFVGNKDGCRQNGGTLPIQNWR